MEFKAAPSRGGIIGVSLVGGVILLQAALLALAAHVGPGPVAALLVVGTALLVPVTLRLALWLWGYLTLRYTVTRDGIIIHWGAIRHAVPMEEISHVLNGRPYTAPLRGLRWPGHELGHTAVATEEGGTRETLVLATQPPGAQLLIVTPGLVYAISPADRGAFVDEFRLRSRLGPVQRLNQGAAQPPWARLPIWHDGLALRMAVLGLALNLLAVTWILWQYPGLPPMMPVHLRYDAARQAAMPGPLRSRGAIWLLPFIGLGGLLLNSTLAVVVHHRARLAALLLLTAAVVLQLALGVALWQII